MKRERAMTRESSLVIRESIVVQLFKIHGCLPMAEA